MTKWDHDVIPVPNNMLAIDIIRNREKRGWELVTIYRDACYFKRPYGQSLADAQDALSLKRAQKINAEMNSPNANWGKKP